MSLKVGFKGESGGIFGRLAGLCVRRGVDGGLIEVFRDKVVGLLSGCWNWIK